MNDAIENPEGFVLIGGASSRMGSDKAQLTLGGRKLFERSAFALSVVCPNRIALVGSVGSNFAGDLPVIRDIRIATGDHVRASIVGLYTALATAKAAWVAILACDLPFVTGDLMIRLAGYRSDQWDAVVPVQPDARPQPLCAFYRRGSCLAVTETMIKSGHLQMQDLVSRLATRFVEFEELADLDGSADFFCNVNSPKDYEHVVAKQGMLDAK